MKAKRASKQSLAQKQRWSKHRKREGALKQARADSARAKHLLHELLYEVTESEPVLLPGNGTAYNVTLDFLGLRFLQCVVENEEFRGKVKEAIQQFDERMNRRSLRE